MMWDEWKTNGVDDWFKNLPLGDHIKTPVIDWEFGKVAGIPDQNSKGSTPNYTYTSHTIPDLEGIINKAMEEVVLRNGNREIKLNYEQVNAMLLLIETLMEMDDDNELARIFKTKLAMQKISGEDCGTKSKG